MFPAPTPTPTTTSTNVDTIATGTAETGSHCTIPEAQGGEGRSTNDCRSVNLHLFQKEKQVLIAGDPILFHEDDPIFGSTDTTTPQYNRAWWIPIIVVQFPLYTKYC